MCKIYYRGYVLIRLKTIGKEWEIVDKLKGLKENVIVGHLIPAGTGFKSHREIEIVREKEA